MPEQPEQPEQPEPLDPGTVTEILDRIPGAYERTMEGLAQAGRG